MTAQLRRRFGQPVEPGGDFDRDLSGTGEWIARDESSGQNRFGILLFGVMQEPGEGHRGMGQDRPLGLP
jgi:hypothetical protein